jgi:hypothetical protein
MYNKAYILTFDRGFLDGVDYVKFHNKLVSAKRVISWWHYLESTYIIIVDFSISPKHITDFVIQNLPQKKFFVCELKLDSHNGFLDPKAWEWINRQLEEGVQ